MKHFASRAAAAVVTVGFVVGLSGMAAPAQALNDDTSWGHINSDTSWGHINSDTSWGHINSDTSWGHAKGGQAFGGR